MIHELEVSHSAVFNILLGLYDHLPLTGFQNIFVTPKGTPSSRSSLSLPPALEATNALPVTVDLPIREVP